MLTVSVPERVRNKCECVTGPQPELVRSICAGVNATRMSGTGQERDRNATGTGVNTALDRLYDIMLWVLGCLSACSGFRDICQNLSNNKDRGSKILV